MKLTGFLLSILFFCLAFTKPDYSLYYKNGNYVSDSLTFILILGESNASGQALNSTAPPAEIGVRSKVKIQHNAAGGQFESLNIKENSAGGNNQLAMNFNTPPNGVFGMELALANMVDSGFLPNPTYLVKAAVGGTLISEWLPGGSQEPTFRVFLDSAFNQMNRTGIPYRTFVWQSIGLNDAAPAHNTPVDSFVARMARYRTYIRGRYGSNIQFLETRFSNTGTGYTFPYAAAIDNMYNTDSRFHSIPCDGATYNPSETNVHFDWHGLGTIAHNMKDTMLKYIAAPAPSGTTNFSFTQIPITTDVPSPGRGAEVWINRPWDNIAGHGVNMPAGNSTRPATNYYQRFSWKDIESDVTAGSYNWSNFDLNIHRAMDMHEMFSFGVMPICSGCGSASFIPTYLHNLMQAEAVKDWFYSADNCWVPNWNSNAYYTRYTALLQAIANHIQNTSYQPAWSSSPIPYKNVIYYVDIRGYGNYGEWHIYPWVTGGFPSNLYPTSNTLKALINANLTIFPNYQASALMGAFYNGSASFVPVDVSYYILTATNNVGRIGWRRDNWGDPQYTGQLENNPETYNPGTGTVNIKDLIMNAWKYGPITGEPNNWTSNPGCGSAYCDLFNQVNKYHDASVGNGNFGDPTQTINQNNYQKSMTAAGYRIVLTGGSMATDLIQNAAFNIKLNVQNIGLAPTYENWNWVYQLRSGSTVVWTGTSAFNPKLFLPSATPGLISDNFTLTGVSVGTYDLYLMIKDPVSYKNPLALAITGRLTDGSYLLRNGISVFASGGSGSNIPPTANISPTSGNITLPTNSITLNGSGSTDPDGTVTTYFWDQVSGPSSATITGATSVSASFNNLIAGTYTFRLKVTDNNGANNTTSISVIVNPAVTPPPTVGGATVFTTQTPAGGTSNDGQAITIGMKFRSTVAGTVQGVRFFKTSGNVGTHIALLYSNTGTLLAQTTFTTESSTGWQNVAFGTPIAILANVTYIVAYFSSSGNYTFTSNGFTSAVTNPPLTGLAVGTDGSNGVYNYGGSPVFPTLNSTPPANYWVDVFFKAKSTCEGGGCLPGRRKPSTVKTKTTP